MNCSRDLTNKPFRKKVQICPKISTSLTSPSLLDSVIHVVVFFFSQGPPQNFRFHVKRLGASLLSGRKKSSTDAAHCPRGPRLPAAGAGPRGLRPAGPLRGGAGAAHAPRGAVRGGGRRVPHLGAMSTSPVCCFFVFPLGCPLEPGTRCHQKIRFGG